MKKTRLVLPVVAFMLAIGAAFATNTNVAPVSQVRISLKTSCADVGYCETSESNNCTSTTYEKFATICGGEVTGGLHLN